MRRFVLVFCLLAAPVLYLLAAPFLFLLAAPAPSLPAAPVQPGDAVRGEALYDGCEDCHSLDKNDVGPRHRGVFGRKAGAVPDYAYSKALRDSGLTWDEQTLDSWLADPRKLVPGAKMKYHLAQARDRADVIAFLKSKAR
jgi:cytochrome c